MESGILDAGATISTRRSGENPRAPELILSSWLKQFAVYDPNVTTGDTNRRVLPLASRPHRNAGKEHVE